MEGYYLGLDIHKRFSQVVVMAGDGELVEHKRVEHGDREGLRDYFSAYDGSQVALEATVGWGWLAEELEAAGLKVHLCHPAAVPLIARGRLKNDTVDAKVLAQLLRTDFLPPAYLAPPEVRQRREVLRSRLGLVRLRTSVKNRIHALMVWWGIPYEFSDLFGQRGREFLRGLELESVRRKILNRWLAALEVLDQLIGEVDKDLRRWLGENREVKLLTSIPGVGVITAWTLFAEIGEVERFPSPKKLAAYAGMVPYTRQSAERLWQQRLCKQGNPYIRSAMIEAGWAAVRCDGQFRSRFERLRHNKGPQTAIFVVARQMLEVVYEVLRQNRPYRPFRLRPTPKRQRPASANLRRGALCPGSASPDA